MLPQEHLITRVRELCLGDEDLVAALTYGSFAQGVGDAHSDVEFWLFFGADQAEVLDHRAWLDRIGPIRHLIVNEFGSHATGSSWPTTSRSVASCCAPSMRCHTPSGICSGWPASPKAGPSTG
ncbi:hypothetical protein [Catellatospora sichuanensis]|uniref:hypothetical protein n=1 Tax=Catellatospora sichuanensis TaxID=1969805 RepID=UPI001183DD01|nr:hypothetical protein [Catellatospora sichuanensis]